MAETSVEYIVTWETSDGQGNWIAHVEPFYGQRTYAEEKYDEIVRLEHLYGTPRNARLRRRAITTSDWEQVER